MVEMLIWVWNWWMIPISLFVEKSVAYCTQSHREVCSNSFLVLWAAKTVSSMFLFQLSRYVAMLVLLHGTEWESTAFDPSSFLFSGGIAWAALVGSRKQLFTQTEILVPFFFEQRMANLLTEIVASYCIEVHINKTLKQVRLFSVPLWPILETSTQVTCLLHPVSPRSLFQ